MNPVELGKRYDRLAQWWQEQHKDSQYGLPALERALAFAADGGNALDVGCGCGGRMIRTLQRRGFAVTGIDVSENMVELARRNHPDEHFIATDAGEWQTPEKFDFILAWDSIFHLPLLRQRPVIDKLCGWLKPDGVIMYSFGNAVGEHTDTWRDDTFYYSSIGVVGNLAALIENRMTVMHLELDQYPESHAFVIARNTL